MCKCLQPPVTLEAAMNTGHPVAAHYHFYPRQIEIFVECEHGNIVSLTAAKDDPEFAALYEALWKRRIDSAAELAE